MATQSWNILLQEFGSDYPFGRTSVLSLKIFTNYLLFTLIIFLRLSLDENYDEILKSITESLFIELILFYACWDTHGI